MKNLLALSILFSTIAWLPVRAELTETDLENIRQIVREEVRAGFREELEKPIIDHIDTGLGEIEATLDSIDTRFDNINRNLDRIQIMLWIATVLVVVAGIFNWTSVLKSWRSP